MTTKTKAAAPIVCVVRIWKDSGEPIAFFPEIPADRRGYLCESYMESDGHGGADYRALNSDARSDEGTRKPYPSERASVDRMKAALVRLGYCCRFIEKPNSVHFGRAIAAARSQEIDALAATIERVLK